MKIEDIIALAKAGYKKKDIDAIIASNKETKEENTDSHAFLSQASEETTTDSTSFDSVVADSESEESETESNDITEDALDIANAEIERLKNELAMAQEKNTRTEVTTTVSTDEETVNDMVKSFM